MIKISTIDLATLLFEMKLIDLYGTQHYGNGSNNSNTVGALREGKSVWLHTMHAGTDFRMQDIFSGTVDFIKRMSDNKPVGRCYVYSLPPGGCIYAHDDCNEDYFNYITRYHVYDKLHAGMEAMHYGEPIAAHGIIKFEHRNLHSYNNKSALPLRFLVYDVFNESMP
jgi:hypothetical protein